MAFFFHACLALALLEGVYSTVVMRDILEREKRRGQKQISDPVLLRKIILFLADNIGNSTSLNSIANTLTSENMPEGRGRRDEEKMYFQGTEDMGAEDVRQREPGPLMDVRDNYEKAVIALNATVTASVEGIKIIRLIDVLPA